MFFGWIDPEAFRPEVNFSLPSLTATTLVLIAVILTVAGVLSWLILRAEWKDGQDQERSSDGRPGRDLDDPGDPRQ